MQKNIHYIGAAGRGNKIEHRRTGGNTMNRSKKPAAQPGKAAEASALSARVGCNLGRIRKRIGMTQTELAHRLHAASSQISNVERGRRNVSLNMVELYAKALEVDPVEFFLPCIRGGKGH